MTGEDIFINNHIWDFMIENPQILDDEKNLIVSPLTSTGIHTVEWFINQFSKNILQRIKIIADCKKCFKLVVTTTFMSQQKLLHL